jgi:hypothetical protein
MVLHTKQEESNWCPSRNRRILTMSLRAVARQSPQGAPMRVMMVNLHHEIAALRSQRRVFGRALISSHPEIVSLREA